MTATDFIPVLLVFGPGVLFLWFWMVCSLDRISENLERIAKALEELKR